VWACCIGHLFPMLHLLPPWMLMCTGAFGCARYEHVLCIYVLRSSCQMHHGIRVQSACYGLLEMHKNGCRSGSYMLKGWDDNLLRRGLNEEVFVICRVPSGHAGCFVSDAHMWKRPIPSFERSNPDIKDRHPYACTVEYGVQHMLCLRCISTLW